MQADNDNLNEPKPKRQLGRAGIAVGLLLLVAIGFANAWWHPRARFMREVKKIERGDTQEAVWSRLKTVGDLGMGTKSGTDTSSSTKVSRSNFQSRDPDWWHFFCPEFPFVEVLRQWLSDWPKSPDGPVVLMAVNFEDGKAVSIWVNGTDKPLAP